MCGAFSIRLSPSEVFFVKDAGSYKHWIPMYNARPGERLPIVTQTDPQKLVSAWWGFVPHWMDPKRGRAVINARGETLTSKPYFRQAIKSQRCVIPADGFYEWEKGGKSKIPYFFHRRDDKPFAFAGIYDALPGQPNHYGFAIITTTPNKTVGRVHDRMPAMLPDDQVDDWLNPEATADQAEKLIRPYPDSLMTSYEVSRAVNYAKNKGPEVAEPIE